MRKILFIAFTLFAYLTSYGQETEVVKDTVIVLQNVVNDKEALKRIKKAEKERKLEEKKQAKLEKKARKLEKVKEAIADKKKDIKKGEKRIAAYKQKIETGKRKGRLSPEEEIKLDGKINKVRLTILKDTDKLKKLERKL